MRTYIIATIMSCLISFIIDKVFGFRKHKVLKMFISLLPLTIIAIFRYDVGWDYLNIYTNGFYWVGKYGLNWFSEPVFNIFISLLYNLFGDPLSLFFFMGIFISYFFSKCFDEFSEDINPIIFIILFVLSRYYFCSLNIMRQALAIMIIIYSTKYIVQKKFYNYFLCVILASLFHQLSLMFIPLYFVLGKRFNNKNNLFVLFIVIPIFIIIGSFFISKTKYVGYFNSMFGNDGSILFGELIICIGVFLIYFNIKNRILIDDNTNIFINMQIIGLIIVLLSWKIPTSDRLYWYFGMQNIFLIPRLLSFYKNQINKIFFGLFIIFLMGITFFTQTYLDDSFSILPYKNIIYERNGMNG